MWSGSRGGRVSASGVSGVVRRKGRTAAYRNRGGAARRNSGGGRHAGTRVVGGMPELGGVRCVEGRTKLRGMIVLGNALTSLWVVGETNSGKTETLRRRSCTGRRSRMKPGGPAVWLCRRACDPWARPSTTSSACAWAARLGDLRVERSPGAVWAGYRQQAALFFCPATGLLHRDYFRYSRISARTMTTGHSSHFSRPVRGPGEDQL